MLEIDHSLHRGRCESQDRTMALTMLGGFENYFMEKILHNLFEHNKVYSQKRYGWNGSRGQGTVCWHLE